MTNLISSQSNHWYYVDKEGEWWPCHQVPYADRSKGMRSVTKADARKLQLVPSVTGITGVVNAPAINNYRVDQAIKSALTLPRELENADGYSGRCIRDLGAEAFNAYAVAKWCHGNPPRPLLTEDEHAQRVVVDAEAHSEAAKLLGSQIHDAILSFMRTSQEPQEYDCAPAAAPYTEPVFRWIMENATEVYALEKIVGSVEHGYGGTMDLDCELKGIGPAIVDWKSQNVRRNGNGPKPEFYPSYGKQLAAYAFSSMGTRRGLNTKLVSVIIDKANAGEVFVKVWDNPAELWAEFLNNCATWRFENRYDPRVL